MVEIKRDTWDVLPENGVFALDIGTRSVIGVVGLAEDDKINVLAIERAEHANRAMVDGQIENIEQVSRLARQVKEQLESKLHYKLDLVCVAAAGRALRTEKASYELELSNSQLLNEEIIQQLEAGAISEAEAVFNNQDDPDSQRQFFLVGYTVTQYYLDNYMISDLKDHHGKNLKADIIATFLPREVVESLCTAMNKIGLEVASLTLEPIAAINAAIPPNLRLLNLALVDIGAGTSDIAVCRDGSITGYTMATLAGDEITETIMREYLVDFHTAERIKAMLDQTEDIPFTDVLGFEQTVSPKDVTSCIEGAVSKLCEEITDKIVEINGGVPSAIFLAGGGSKLSGLREAVIASLKMNEKRVAIAGNNFQIHTASETCDLNNPEYATPLGIAISAGLHLINDCFRITLNNKPARLFKSGSLSVMNVLMMNGYLYQDMISRSGQNLIVSVNGKRTIFRGEPGEPAVLQINGKDAKITDILEAGDSILFTPARQGNAAFVLLAEAVTPGEAAAVTVNGQLVPWDTPLRSGDIIKTSPLPSPGNEQQESDGASEAVSRGTALEDTDLDEAVLEDAALEEPVLKDAALEETVLEEAALEEAVLKKSEAAVHDGFPKSTKDHQSKASGDKPKERPTITFFLNDKPLKLAVKKDGTPYYFMELLEYSDIDFDHLSAPVTLEVNNSPAYFQQELKNGDHISIRIT